MVDSIEEHIEMTTHHVHEGHQQLKKALANKNAQVPIAAAAVGATAVGGPIGFAAGSVALGTIAAVGGAVAGLFGGKWIKKNVQESTKVSTSEDNNCKFLFVYFDTYSFSGFKVDVQMNYEIFEEYCGIQ